MLRGELCGPLDRLEFLLQAVLLCALPIVALGLACGGPPSRDEAYFDEVSAAESGVDFRHDNGSFGSLSLVEIMGPGGALFDMDRDGDLDLFVVQGRSLDPNAPDSGLGDRLYRNDLNAAHDGDGDGTSAVRFTDVTQEAGLADPAHRGYGLGVAVGDIDNDGLPDVYVTRFGANQLWHNQGLDASGRVRFEAADWAGVADPSFSVGATFLDFDGDGRLDLYVANYVVYDPERAKPCRTARGTPDYCAPLSYLPEVDRLFRNLGPDAAGRIHFLDVSEIGGIHSVRRNGLGVLASDFDDDGWTDILVANDQQGNLLWRNRGDGTFEDLALLAGLAVNGNGVAEASMGVAAGDIDGDGDEDMLLTHLRSETHTLYVRRGPLHFDDQTLGAGLAASTLPMTGFGAAFLDVDLDGRLDLLVADGAVRVIEEQVFQGDSHPLHLPDQLLMQTRDARTPHFEDASSRGGEHFLRSEVGRGLAVGDLDNDGDEDAVIFNNGGPVRILTSHASERGRWIGVTVLDERTGRVALGVKVTVTLDDGSVRTRWPRRDGSYASSRDPRVLVGLGATADPVRLEAIWPDGYVVAMEEPNAGRYYELRRPAGSP